MVSLGECMPFRQWSGCICSHKTPSLHLAPSVAPGVPLRLESSFLGGSLKSPVSSVPRILTALVSPKWSKSSFVKVGGADVSKRLMRPCAVVTVGRVTQEDRGQEQAALEVPSSSQNGIAKRSGVPSGLLRFEKDALQASARARTRAFAELPKGIAKDPPTTVTTDTSDEAPKKRSKSLLDSIRNKVLNTSEETLAKAVLKRSPVAKKLVARRLLKTPPTAVVELPEVMGLSQGLGNREDVLDNPKPPRASVRLALGKRVNGHANAAEYVQKGPEAVGVNGALWAVSAVASRIANGTAMAERSMGSVIGEPDEEGEGPLDAGKVAPLNGTFADGGCPEKISTSSDDGIFETPAEDASVKSQSAAPKRGRRVKKGSLNEIAEEHGVAFEEGVMDAVRQAVTGHLSQEAPIPIKTQEASSSDAQERGVSEEEVRKFSGSSASTSGRDAANSSKATRVCAATESLIEEALAGAQKPPAPARRTRKRVQKVVSLEEACGGEGECQKLKRVRKRVRVRSEVAATMEATEVRGQAGASASGVDTRQVEPESRKGSEADRLGSIKECPLDSADESTKEWLPAKLVPSMIGAANGAAPALWKSVGSLGDSKSATQVQDAAVSDVLQLEGKRNCKEPRSINGQVTVASGPIQALRASAPGVHQGDLVSSRQALKVASQRGAFVGVGVPKKGEEVGDFGQEDGGLAVATKGAAERDMGSFESPTMATMKVPIGPIEALRASASRPAQDATAVTAVTAVRGAPQNLRPQGRQETIDYLSDLIDGEVEEGFGLQTMVVPAAKSAVLTRLDRPEKGGKEFRSWGRKQPAQAADYFTNSMLNVHSKTKLVQSEQEDTFEDFDLDQFDYSVEAPKASERSADTEGSLGGSHSKERKRRRGQLGDEEQTSSASAQGTAVTHSPTAVGRGEPVFLMRASWRDLSEGRLDPVGYEVVSAKSGSLIGTVTALDALKPEEEKEMEETGLHLHTSVLQVTAVEGFVDEFEAEKVELEPEEAVTQDESESESESDTEDLEEDGDLLADLDEMKAALGLSEDGKGGESEAAPRQSFAIPVLKEYIADVSQKERRIVMSLPGPLHRISRRPATLRGLGMALYKYCSGKSRTVKMLARNKAGRGRGAEHYRSASGRHISTVHPQVTYMPTEKELLADGRDDIIEDIHLVGGFAAATHALGLSRQKRPIGFWENKLHLDAEIELFNYSRWVERTDPETGAIYWVNLLNDMVSRTKPPPPDSLTPPLPVSYREEDVGTACMPKRKDVQEAGRWDLHHAIVSHGGYTMVSRDLGRQSPLPRSAAVREQASKYAFPEMLVAAIRKLMKEKGLTKLPSIRDFEKMGRADIVFGFRRHGGLLAVAELMKVEPKHNVQWTLESATAALNEYVDEKAQKTGQERSMPTLKELQQAGKSNLRYVIQHFGQKVMAEQLGLRPNLSTQEKSKLRAQQQNEERRKKTRSRGQPIRTSQEHLARFRK